MSTSQQQIIDCLADLVLPNIGRGQKKANQREINYFVALGSCLGKGTAALYQLSFQFAEDMPGLYSAIVNSESFRPAMFAQLMQKWQLNIAFDPDPRFDNQGPLTSEDLTFWQEHGYVIVKNVIAKEQAQHAAHWLMHQAGMTLDDPDTWRNRARGEIWEEVYQHPNLEYVRESTKARQAFEQLWQSDSLTPSIDRASINLPESSGSLFPGPYLHFDVNFSQPLYFTTQGMLYLNDVAEDQGAFTCCPGFHKHYRQWIDSVKHMNNPNDADFSIYPAKHIAAKAGDLIIWHHWLPHGSSPNTSSQPRLAQYFTMTSLEPCFV